MYSLLQLLLHYLFLGAVIALVFGLAVLVHEFGHLMFAILRGVGVESFAIGMGPKITQWHWRGIEFSLRWIPAGGFVKLAGLMPGEEPEPIDGPQTRAFAPIEQTNSVELGRDAEGLPVRSEAKPKDQAPSSPNAESKDGSEGKDGKSLTEASYDDMLALADKGVLTKVMVFGGGVFMNYVTAVVAMAVFLMLPKPVPLNELKVWNVQPDSPMGLVGLRTGDQIVSVNGQPVHYQYELFQAIDEQIAKAGIDPGSDQVSSFTLKMAVQRKIAGVTTTAALAPVPLGRLKVAPNAKGLEFALAPVVGSVIMDQPAYKAGIQSGDRIVSINGKPIVDFNQMFDLIGKNVGKPVTIEFEHEKKIAVATITPVPDYKDPSVGKIGITPGGPQYGKIPGEGFLSAVVAAPGETWAMLKDLINQHIKFFRHASFKQIRDGVGGPVMIGRLVSQAVNMGPAYLVNFFIMLNLLLMVFNLLPLPVLDGGFIMLSLVEAVIRRPVPPRVLNPIYTVFVIFFISLMVIITLWDVKRWIS